MQELEDRVELMECREGVRGRVDGVAFGDGVPEVWAS